LVAIKNLSVSPLFAIYFSKQIFKNGKKYHVTWDLTEAINLLRDVEIDNQV
jgi:hypothetical protein